MSNLEIPQAAFATVQENRSSFFATGILLNRIVAGYPFDSPEDRQNAEKLLDEVPSVELRGTPSSHRPIELQQISRGEISYLPRRYRSIQDVPLTEAVETIFNEVPSLSQPQTFTPVKLRPCYPKSRQETFLVIEPSADELEILKAEKQAIHEAVETIARQSPLRWPSRSTDLTVAYIPLTAPKGTVSRTMRILQPYLGQSLTLLPVERPH
jgi:hypothetical protein